MQVRVAGDWLMQPGLTTSRFRCGVGMGAGDRRGNNRIITHFEVYGIVWALLPARVLSWLDRDSSNWLELLTKPGALKSYTLASGIVEVLTQPLLPQHTLLACLVGPGVD